MERVAVIAALADAIMSLRPGHPTRVGVEGWSCSGKTTVADELAAAIQATGRESLRASFDNFHPRGYKHRAAGGDWPPQAYYDEGYDYATFRTWVLEPLGPGGQPGTRRCRTAMLHSGSDTPLPEVWHDVADDGVVVVDGILLRHPAIADHWDYVIWIDVDLETMIGRARQRDGAWYGSEVAAEERYRRVRQPLYEYYERLASPRARADAILDNRVFERPRLTMVTRRAESMATRGAESMAMRGAESAFKSVD
jgi:uridine kinase